VTYFKSFFFVIIIIPGADGVFFSIIANEINRALEKYFPAEQTSGANKLKIISEPGTYYACSAFTLCANVIAKRIRIQSTNQDQDETLFSSDLSDQEAGQIKDKSKFIQYFINDSLFASFLFHNYAISSPIPIQVRDY
jgi:ornithine decarboxylase